MIESEIEQVLGNWIEQALSPTGKLREGITPANWVANNFIRCWRNRVEDSLQDGEPAVQRRHSELVQLGNPARLGEAYHELTHIRDALGDLRHNLGMTSTDHTNT